jgi:DNA-binding transcriptional ArsR family regulator
MDTKMATASFSAFSQETRLAAFRLMVRHEPEGLPAGEIARQLSVPHNTLSTHLAVLERAGWVTSCRQSRSIIYRANLEHMQTVLDYLVRDCCADHASVCALPSASSCDCQPDIQE